MLLGFISLLLTVGQSPISNICISKKVGATWHPCGKDREKDESYDNKEETETESESSGRRLLAALESGAGGSFRRVLAAGGTDNCAKKVRPPGTTN